MTMSHAVVVGARAASTCGQGGAHLVPMRESDLDTVLRIEQGSYGQPWSRRNFADSLQAGNHAQCLWLAQALIGYFVALPGFEEVHLLNLTVAPDWRRQGWARVMLEALTLWAQARLAHWIWLEVRAGNDRAQHVYQDFGFQAVGRRRAYYSDGRGRHEDAVLMSLSLPEVNP